MPFGAVEGPIEKVEDLGDAAPGWWLWLGHDAYYTANLVRRLFGSNLMNSLRFFAALGMTVSSRHERRSRSGTSANALSAMLRSQCRAREAVRLSHAGMGDLTGENVDAGEELGAVMPRLWSAEICENL